MRDHGAIALVDVKSSDRRLYFINPIVPLTAALPSLPVCMHATLSPGTPAPFRSLLARRYIILGLLVSCLLISVPAVLSYRAAGQLRNSYRWVTHTLEVERRIERLLSLLTEAETGQRGYLLSMRTEYLEPYQAAMELLPSELAQFRELTVDNPVQRENYRQLSPLVAQKLELMAQTITLEGQGEHEAVMAIIQSDRGRVAMDAIRLRLKAMGTEEARLLLAREAVLESRARFSSVFLFILVGLNLLLAVVLTIAFHRLSRAQGLVTLCAWSRTVEFEGEWLSFEQYLLRKFNLNTSHGISPAEAKKAFGLMREEETALRRL